MLNKPPPLPTKEPEKDPVNAPSLEPKVITSSPNEPDLLIKARPSKVFKAISPKSIEDVDGTLPGTADLRSLRNWFDICPLLV
jgi:hypothetical protein